MDDTAHHDWGGRSKSEWFFQLQLKDVAGKLPAHGEFVAIPEHINKNDEMEIVVHGEVGIEETGTESLGVVPW